MSPLRSVGLNNVSGEAGTPEATPPGPGEPRPLPVIRVLTLTCYP